MSARPLSADAGTATTQDPSVATATVTVRFGRFGVASVYVATYRRSSAAAASPASRSRSAWNATTLWVGVTCGGPFEQPVSRAPVSRMAAVDRVRTTTLWPADLPDRGIDAICVVAAQVR
jgi:hypothetical protein